MKKEKLLLQTAMTLLVFVAFPLSAAETTKYTGTVFASPVKHLMPLSNGDAVLMIESSGIMALSGNPPTINTISCSGMGYQTVDNNTTTDFYCNIKENDSDSLDLKGKATDKGNESDGSFDVIGGSGKWKGASGKGKFIRLEKSAGANKTFLEIEVTTP